jgi:hypothetical protein
MSINLTDFKDIYKDINDDFFARLKDLQESTQMEDESLAKIASNGYASGMATSVEVLKALKQNALVDAQIESETKRALDIASSTSVRDIQSTKDLLVKDEEINIRKENIYTIIAKRKREQGVTESNGTLTYTNDLSSHIENQIDLLKKQVLKVEGDTTYTQHQTSNMDMQVRHNVIIQAMDKAATYNMGIGNAGLIPTAAMHTNFFVQNKALMADAGIKFATDGTTSFTPDNSTSSITLGTFNVDVGTPAKLA